MLLFFVVVDTLVAVTGSEVHLDTGSQLAHVAVVSKGTSLLSGTKDLVTAGVLQVSGTMCYTCVLCTVYPLASIGMGGLENVNTSLAS